MPGSRRFKSLVLLYMGKHARVFFVLLAVLPHGGCADFAERAAVKFFYREASLPQQQVYKDLAYWSDPLADPRKHRLDFFVPKGGRWPVMVFVHGGAWRRGDKALEFGGADPYGNIGRFYAARGVGVAVINYRLQPAVTWREQILDVARAMVWVYEHADNYGADKHAVFLFGHSSGAHLVARTALDEELLRKAGVRSGIPCGVIAVSGAPYDIADEKTYELGTSRARFERPFRATQRNDRWKYDASPLHLVTHSAPPFLLLHGAWEARGLKRQNQIMAEALQNAGVPNRLVEAGWEGHSLIVASLSRPDTEASAAVLEFIRKTKCA